MTTTADIVVSAARLTDVPMILAFIRELAAYENLSNACVATEIDLQRTLFGERPYAEVLMARYKNVPAGYALFFHSYSTFLAKPGIFLEDVYVTPEHRRHGIGKAILREVAGIARDRNCGRLEWAVLDWNEPSIAFYRSLGAEPMDDWTTFRLTEDALAKLAR